MDRSDLQAMADLYAKRFVDAFDGFETPAEYAEQAAIDLGMPRVRQMVRKAIKDMTIQEAIERNARAITRNN